jgi:hypothetical protein
MRLEPDMTMQWKMAFAFVCLIFPATGLTKAIHYMLSCASISRDPLQRAARAGALFHVVRDHGWKPLSGTRLENCVFFVDGGQDESTDGIRWPQQNVHQLTMIDSDTKSMIITTYRPAWIIYQRKDEDKIQNRTSIRRFWKPVDGKRYGYKLAIVPATSRIQALEVDDQQREALIHCTYRPVNALVALVQLLYSMTTLYRSQGHQVATFGYAAFGLTVAPYAIMSFMNLMSFLLCPDYEGMYLVQSSVLDEARRAMPGTTFPSPVGRLVEKSTYQLQLMPCTFRGLQGVTAEAQVTGVESSPKIQVTKISKPSLDPARDDSTMYEPIPRPGPRCFWGDEEKPPYLLVPQCNPLETSLHPIWPVFPGGKTEHAIRQKKPILRLETLDEERTHRTIIDFIKIVLSMVVYGAIIATVGGISHFQKGQSTFAQRFWTMAWLATGLFFVLLSSVGEIMHPKLVNVSRSLKLYSDNLVYSLIGFYLLTAAILAVPAFGGFVVVGQMLKSYGSCTKFR